MTASIVVLSILVAFAIDLGQARWGKRDSQQAADLASLAAGYYLSGNGSSGLPALEPLAACQAAFNSVETNVEDFSPPVTASTACASFPVTGAACDSSTAPITTGPIDGGTVTLTITWPVPDDQIADPRLGGSGTMDGEQCERMEVQLDRSDATNFATVIGIDSVESTAHAVVRGSPGLNTEGVAALLLLEREGCETLQTSGQGAVVVNSVVDPGSMTEQPGVIQSDSAGSTSFPSPLQCTTNENPGGYTIYGTALPASKGGGPSIVAEETTSGDPGIIATHALSVGGRGACCYPGGLNVAPTGSNVTSRAPADKRFNPGSRPAIADLHSDAWFAAVTNGGTVVGEEITDCNPADGTVIQPTVPGDPITINCGNNPFRVQNNRSVVISGASSVKFIGGIDASGTLEVQAATTVTLARNGAGQSGRLEIGNNGFVSIDTPQRVYVGGHDTSDPAVEVAGTLRVNTGSAGVSACAEGPGSGGVYANWTALATVGGTVDITGSVSLCQTMTYIGESQDAYAPKQRTAGGLNCSPASPCPLLTTDDSRDRLLLSGGSSSVIWTAPDQTVTQPDATNPFEGLSLWVEGTGLNEIKATGNLETTGVYFLPNARFEFDGQAAATNPFNAQFFTRTLDFSGQGDLNLSPDPRDSVKTPIPGSYALIR